MISKIGINKEHFFAKSPYLEEIPRLVFIAASLYLCVSTANKAFTQAPLIIFLLGCASAFVGLNGMKLSSLNVSTKGIGLASFSVDGKTPVPKKSLTGSGEDARSNGLVTVQTDSKLKTAIAGIATTAAGETTLPGQISAVYAVSGDPNNLVIFTTDNRAIELDFMSSDLGTSKVGIS